MKRPNSHLLATASVSMMLAFVGAIPAHADFELKDAGGRRILLKDDGT